MILEPISPEERLPGYGEYFNVLEEEDSENDSDSSLGHEETMSASSETSLNQTHVSSPAVSTRYPLIRPVID